MKALRIDPAKLDLIFLSHMHSDHIGGFWEVIKENHKTSVYIPGSFPESFKEEAGKHGLILFEVIQPLRLSAGVFSTGYSAEVGHAFRCYSGHPFQAFRPPEKA
jgi:7,8-dihydropterin-6-yl-methyl-4-(beta-D-ribofuranosyl)aminobenzene 5'-phosphate synthase